MPSKRINFSDIIKLKKGDPLPEGCNIIAIEIIKSMPIDRSSIDTILDDLETIEDGKWYGVWPVMGASFIIRHGVFQNVTIIKQLGATHFNMNIINTNIDFRREKQNG
jgi:hypothetical protein